MSPEQIAKEFVGNLENNPDARRQFLSENYQDSVWLQCPPHNGEPVDFWQYGPPIPGTEGYIYRLGEIWYNSHLEGWIARYGDCASYLTNLAIDDAKKVIKSAVEKEYETNYDR